MQKNTLLIGYGNPGRRDDGLGPKLAEAIESLCLPGVTVDSNYQLTVEDAAEAARHDVVIFADAAVSGPEPFCFSKLEPEAAVAFTSHSLTPGTVLYLCKEFFGCCPEAYLLSIRGYEFNVFEQQLSEGANANLIAACSFIRERLSGCSVNQSCSIQR